MAKRIAGVLGWPVSHSLSPKLHHHWLKTLGIDGEYKALAVEPKDLQTTLKALPDMGWQGCNLTIPHKEAALPFLDELDDTARAIGAVNTVIVRGGKLIGSNTDAYGFAENIRAGLTGTHKAVVLGAGGAAKAVCYALHQLGFQHIVIANRTREKAEALAASFQNVQVGAWDNNLLADADLLVNATSLGMTGKEPLEMDLSRLPVGALVTDIVYAPLITPLLAAAKARGNPIVDGLGMLLHQAVPGFAAWFGVRPQVTAQLREHVLGS